ncbi:MAG: dUTP diphosphatase [Candidatus Hydrogenedens sp.]|nr:dUTP diphosphatase [Candidatus Hydrogenedens sp.]
MTSSPLNVPLQKLPHGADLPLPAYATAHSSGVDLPAAVTEPVILQPGKRMAVPTGLALAIPPGYEAQIRPRSGLALRHGLTIINAPGTIDADYRGEIKVLLANLGDEPFTINRGDRIAQLIIAPVVQAHWQVVVDLPETDRGTGGFGHTGI